MEFPTENFGAVPSPFDYRDEYASAAAIAAATAAPVSIDLTKLPVLMQGQRPACVAHAAATLMMAYHYLKTGEIVRFSPRFIDAYMKTFDGLGPDGSGAYPRFSFKTLAKVGCATEAMLPNDVSLSDEAYRDPSILTDAVMLEAARYKIPGYVSIKLDGDSARHGMSAFGPLSILLQIGREWYTAPDGTTSYDPAKIMPLRPPAAIISGHEIVRHVSADPDLDTIRNSWSASWGFEGDGTLHPSQWAPFLVEQWAIAEIPADISALLASLPAPADFHYQWTRTLVAGNTVPDDDVRYAQIALMILGFLGPVPADELGFFGPKTEAAVLKYQQSKRIATPAPFSIGPLTRGFLNKDFAV